MTAARQALGKAGEDLAAQHLQRLGAKVLGRNVQTGAGELDLVMEHEGDLVAVEVKTRRPGQPALPEEAVNRSKAQRLQHALARFAQDHGYDERGWRIDVVAIELDARGNVQRFDHIRDAVSGG